MVQVRIRNAGIFVNDNLMHLLQISQVVGDCTIECDHTARLFCCIAVFVPRWPVLEGPLDLLLLLIELELLLQGQRAAISPLTVVLQLQLVQDFDVGFCCLLVLGPGELQNLII